MATGEEVKLTKGGVTDAGIKARKEQLTGLPFNKDKAYGATDDTFNYEDNPLGKGTSNQTKEYLTLGEGTPTSYASQFDTTDGGNVYDRQGTLYGGSKSGRNGLNSINKYNASSYYGVNSPIQDENMAAINFNKRGQTQLNVNIVKK